MRRSLRQLGNWDRRRRHIAQRECSRWLSVESCLWTKCSTLYFAPAGVIVHARHKQCRLPEQNDTIRQKKDGIMFVHLLMPENNETGRSTTGCPPRLQRKQREEGRNSLIDYRLVPEPWSPCMFFAHHQSVPTQTVEAPAVIRAFAQAIQGRCLTARVPRCAQRTARTGLLGVRCALISFSVRRVFSHPAG